VASLRLGKAQLCHGFVTRCPREQTGTPILPRPHRLLSALEVAGGAHSCKMP